MTQTIGQRDDTDDVAWRSAVAAIATYGDRYTVRETLRPVGHTPEGRGVQRRDWRAAVKAISGATGAQKGRPETTTTRLTGTRRTATTWSGDHRAEPHPARSAVEWPIAFVDESISQPHGPEAAKYRLTAVLYDRGSVIDGRLAMLKMTGGATWHTTDAYRNTPPTPTATHLA